MTHSPGPWHWEAAHEGADHWLLHSGPQDDDGDMLSRTVLVAEGGKWPPSADDAILMAAAPDLLRLLKRHVFNCECAVSSGCHAAQARALIATLPEPP